MFRARNLMEIVLSFVSYHRLSEALSEFSFQVKLKLFCINIYVGV